MHPHTQSILLLSLFPSCLRLLSQESLVSLLPANLPVLLRSLLKSPPWSLCRPQAFSLPAGLCEAFLLCAPGAAATSVYHRMGFPCLPRMCCCSQSLSHVQLSATPWTAARQASLSFTISWSLLKLVSIELVMPSNHLILGHPLLLLFSICPQHQGLLQ